MLLILWMILIFCFSNQRADDSSKLIVYKDTYSSGTETDTWKTFSYEGYTRTSFSFDVNT